MITNFIVVPTYASELLMWFAIGVYVSATGFSIKARVNYKKADRILKEQTKEMEAMLEKVHRDAITLSKEIDEVRKLKLE